MTKIKNIHDLVPGNLYRYDGSYGFATKLGNLFGGMNFINAAVPKEEQSKYKNFVRIEHDDILIFLKREYSSKLGRNRLFFLTKNQQIISRFDEGILMDSLYEIDLEEFK